MGRNVAIIFALILSLSCLIYIRRFSVNSKQSLLIVSSVCINNDYQHNVASHINIGFSNFAIVEAKQYESELEEKYDITAILIHGKPSENMIQTIEYLVHSRRFKEIIIWNNDPGINLTKIMFQATNNTFDSIRIINSNENFKNKAKYLACSQAKTTTCFYVNSNCNIASYLKTLIADFRSDPSILHTVIDPFTFYTNLIWTYFDEKIDLHTGFSWIGCGSIFLREHAQRHLQYLHIYLKNYPNMSQYIDVFFPIWLNDIPSQFNMNIRHLSAINTDEQFPPFHKFLDNIYQSSLFAVRILENSLRQNQSNDSNMIAFPRQKNRRFPNYVKSPNVKDEFIFYTNILPINSQRIPFNISKAVDNDLNTCWRSRSNVIGGDFFGIDFLYIQTNLTFSITIEHTKYLQKKLDLNFSLDGLWWLTYLSLNGITEKPIDDSTSNFNRYTIIFNSTEFNLGFHSFRYVAFNSTETFYSGDFQVCDVQIL